MNEMVSLQMIEYRHIKTGEIYQVHNHPVLNATNDSVGQAMMLYVGKGKIFVREMTEFMQKFELLSTTNEAKIMETKQQPEKKP